MSNLDADIFGGKKLKDLFQEIYTNQKKKEKQISSLIEELKPLIDDIGDATLVVPLIKEYLEIGVKNDEQLIKMATIIQRCLSNDNSNGEGLLISDEEKAQLLGEINKIQENLNNNNEN
jgi:ferritin